MTQIKATYIDHMGSDLSVVNSARVSFGKAHTEFDSTRDTKLIKFLAREKHTSPFGHAFASFHVVAPIFVARQLVKHKFLRWNEVSRRYVDDEPEFYIPEVWRGRSEDKKQGSDGVVSNPYSATFAEDYHAPLYLYKDLLERGVAPEQARMVLPQSTMTEWYWSGSLDAFADMCRLRCASDTQYESRIVADQISELMSALFPVSWDALMKDKTMSDYQDIMKCLWKGVADVEQQQDAADRMGELEAKLERAVELALTECPFHIGTPNHTDWWNIRRTNLAGLTGQDDE